MLTLCDPVDWSPPGSSVHGILQARMLEWVACPPPGHLPDPAIEPSSLMSPVLEAGSLALVPPGKLRKKEQLSAEWLKGPEVCSRARGSRMRPHPEAPWKPHGKEGRSSLSSGLYSWGSTHPKRSSYSSPGEHSWGSQGSNGVQLRETAESQAPPLCHSPAPRALLFSHSVVSDSLRPHGLQHARLPCPSPSPGAYSNSSPWV